MRGSANRACTDAVCSGCLLLSDERSDVMWLNAASYTFAAEASLAAQQICLGSFATALLTTAHAATLRPSMHKQLSRKQLYELVWAKPRTELAKQFNISDVALGKLCREMNVPAPPPGYWAHVAANGRNKAKYVRPPLMYTVAERIAEDHLDIEQSLPKVDPEKLDEPLPPPPTLAETLDEAVSRYVQLVIVQPHPKAGRGTHPVVAKLLKEDERLAAVATTYSWERPKYQTPTGAKLLAGLNKLLWWWSDLGFVPSSSGTRHIRLYVSLGSYDESFEITAPTDGAQKTEHSARLFELRFDIDSRYSRQPTKPALTFSSFDNELFVATARLLIERREKSFRDWLKRVHEHTSWKREEAIKKDQAEKEAARKRREADHKALLDGRERAIDEAVLGMSRADHLRFLVEQLEPRMRRSGERDPKFEVWKKWMLAKADHLDIRSRSDEALSQWIDRFRLAPDEIPGGA